jgi:hypothetical protein
VTALETFETDCNSFGLIDGEQDISFEKPYPSHRAIRSESLADKMTKSHNEIDGLTWGLNGNCANYTLGSKFASGKNKGFYRVLNLYKFFGFS